MSLFDDCTAVNPKKVPRRVCAFDIGQGQKLAVWLANKTPFTATTILTAAGWTAATTDATNPVIVTNTISNFAIAGSERVENASDTNANAMPELMRAGNVLLSGMIRGMSPAEYEAYVSLTGFSQVDVGFTNLVGVIINSQNQVIYNKNSSNLGFSLYALFMGDPSVTATLGQLSESTLSTYLKGGWFKDAAKGQIAFDFLNTYPTAA